MAILYASSNTHKWQTNLIRASLSLLSTYTQQIAASSLSEGKWRLLCMKSFSFLPSMCKCKECAFTAVRRLMVVNRMWHAAPSCFSASLVGQCSHVTTFFTNRIWAFIPLLCLANANVPQAYPHDLFLASCSMIWKSGVEDNRAAISLSI